MICGKVITDSIVMTNHRLIIQRVTQECKGERKTMKLKVLETNLNLRIERGKVIGDYQHDEEVKCTPESGHGRISH